MLAQAAPEIGASSRCRLFIAERSFYFQAAYPEGALTRDFLARREAIVGRGPLAGPRGKRTCRRCRRPWQVVEVIGPRQEKQAAGNVGGGSSRRDVEFRVAVV